MGRSPRLLKISSGKSTTGLIRYLFDTKKAKDHTDPHLVASWDGFAPDPGRATDAQDAVRKRLVADLDLRVNQARRHGRAPERHVWHCSIRAATTDRHLGDDEWADIAPRIVGATGIAPTGDPDGCRWVAVRHAPDHIHIAATTVRADLRPARHWNDYLTADRELAAIEKEYGLFQVVRGDRTAAKRPTRAEQEKARPHGQAATPREHLRSMVRTLVAGARSTEEFLYLLAHTDGVQVQVKHFPSGDIRGYTVALTGDTNQAGSPSGSPAPNSPRTCPFRRSRSAWTTSSRTPTTSRSDVPPIPGIKRQPPPNASPTISTTPPTTRPPRRTSTPSAKPSTPCPSSRPHLCRLNFGRWQLSSSAPSAPTYRPSTRHARALRGAVRSILRKPAPQDGAVLAMFLDAAILATLAALRWHQHRHHNQQAAAAQRALRQLQSAYIEAAAVPMAALAQQRPPQLTVERHIAMVRQVVPEYAEKIVEDTAFDALTATLVQAQGAGHAPEQILRTAIGRRTLADTEHPAGFSPAASNASSPARHPAHHFTPPIEQTDGMTIFKRAPPLQLHGILQILYRQAGRESSSTIEGKANGLSGRPRWHGLEQLADIGRIFVPARG